MDWFIRRSRSPGFARWGAEVVWTRSCWRWMLGVDGCTFSIILAVFLIGLGIGSGGGSVWTRTLKNPRVALGACQLALAFAVAWTAYAVSDLIPSWPFNPHAVANPWHLFRVDFLMSLFAILPPALLWGLSFRCCAGFYRVTGSRIAGALVGKVYAAYGGRDSGRGGIQHCSDSWVGTQGAEQALIALSMLAGLILFYKAGLSGAD